MSGSVDIALETVEHVVHLRKSSARQRMGRGRRASTRAAQQDHGLVSLEPIAGLGHEVRVRRTVWKSGPFDEPSSSDSGHTNKGPLGIRATVDEHGIGSRQQEFMRFGWAQVTGIAHVLSLRTESDSVVVVSEPKDASPENATTNSSVERLRYRLLSGHDTHAFCVRVSDALAEGYELYGSPALTFDGTTTYVAQAVVLPPGVA